MSEFQLIIVKAEDKVWVFTSLPEETQAAIGEACKTHKFVLKSPISYSLEMEKQKLMLVPDHLGLGLRMDTTLEDPATAVAFLQSWTLDEPLSLESAKTLHPVLLQSIAGGVRAQVNPWAGDMANFFPQLTGNGAPSPDTPSEPSNQNGEISTNP